MGTLKLEHQNYIEPSGQQANFQGMILGACLEADRRVRDFEAQMRMQKRMLREKALWEKYEDEYDQLATQKKPK